jgi:hypothetical protein
LVSEEQSNYLGSYADMFRNKFYNGRETYFTHEVFLNHPELSYDLRARMVDWLYHVNIKAKVEDLNVLFNAI